MIDVGQAYLEWACEKFGEVLGSATEHNSVDAHISVTQSDCEVRKCCIVEKSFVQV